VLLDSVPGATPGAIPDSLAPAPDVAVTFTEWRPGRMRMQLGAPAPSAGYVLVSENWDQEWRASVDGAAAPVMRGNGTLITVPVPAGARSLELRYEGRAYARGRLVTLLSLLVVALGLVVSVVLRRRPRSELP
jgi:uncharacterized membrane protein YfhO